MNDNINPAAQTSRLESQMPNQWVCHIHALLGISVVLRMDVPLTLGVTAAEALHRQEASRCHPCRNAQHMESELLLLPLPPLRCCSSS